MNACHADVREAGDPVAESARRHERLLGDGQIARARGHDHHRTAARRRRLSSAQVRSTAQGVDLDAAKSPRKRGGRPIVAETGRAVAVGGGRRGVDERHPRRRAPVQQLEREPEVVLEHEIGVGRSGVRDGAHVDDGIEFAAVEPGQQISRRNDVGQAALAQVAPLAARPDHVVDNDVGPAGIV